MSKLGLPFVSVLVCLAASVACGGAAREGGQAASADPAPADPESFDQQAALGQKLYLANCARCHGVDGQGSATAPRLVGLAEGALPLNPPPGAKLRTTPFKTAADVADFVVHNMPENAPGSLSEPTYWAILAFALKANGVEESRPLDAATAKGIVLHH